MEIFLVRKKSIYFCGQVKELKSYLKKLSNQYSSLQELLNAYLN